jgi:hypothetical protein
MVAYPFGPSWAAVGEQVTAGYAAFFFSLYGTRLSVIALLTGFNLTSKALNDMTPGNLLILAGLLAVGLGLWWKFAPKGLPRFPLGNLPGDIRIEREGFRMYVPVTTCIVLSGLFWLVQFLMNRSVP